MDDIIRSYFVIDGNYTRKGFAHLAEDGIEGNFYSMDFSALCDYTASVIEAETGRRCIFTGKKVFMGTNEDFDRKNQKFYRTLDEADFLRSTFTLRASGSGGRHPSLKEDAVDTTIVFDTAREFFTKKCEERFDMLVLYAGDGDLSVLVSGLKKEGVRVVVIYYDFKTPFSVTRASQKLLETADKVISISSLLDDRVSQQIKAIFQKTEPPAEEPFFRPAYQRSQFRPFPDYCAQTVTEQLLKDCMEECRKDSDGWVLVAQLGKKIEYRLRAKLPAGIKLRAEIEKYPGSLETKETPAFSVRIKKAERTEAAVLSSESF